MSLKVETLYSVPYAQTTETIQAPEFWNAYRLSAPTQNEGYVQAYMHFNGLWADAKVVPYSSIQNIGIYPMPLFDTYAYVNGRSTGDLVSNFYNYPNNFPYIAGYYWDENRQTYRNYHRSGLTNVSFEFWDPSTLSYHEVGIRWKLRDEHDVIYTWPTSGTTYTCSGCQVYPPTSSYYPTAVKTDDLYFTFMDGSGTDRYICDEYLTFEQYSGSYSSGQLEVTGYRDSFNPYTSVISYRNAVLFPTPSDSWVHFVDSSDDASKAYPIIQGVHKNLDDPDKNWVGTLTMGVRNKSLWAYGIMTRPNLENTWQCKGAQADDTAGPPTDQEGYLIHIPERYGPFGNWLVRLQPAAMLNTPNLPIQQRIHTVNKSIEVSFDDTPPGPTINP